MTELGYPSCRGARNRPWDYTARTGVDLSEQHELFAAFIGEWDRDPALAGVYVWAAETGRGGHSDAGYAVTGKPSESLLRAWFWSRRSAG